MEGNVPNLKPGSSISATGRAGPRYGSSPASRGPERPGGGEGRRGRGRSPGPAPGTPAPRRARPPAGLSRPPPGRPHRREPGGVGALTCAGVPRGHARLRERRRAATLRPFRARDAGPPRPRVPGARAPRPAPPRPPWGLRGSHWLLVLLNRPRRRGLAVRRGASAPPRDEAGGGGREARRVRPGAARGVWRPRLISAAQGPWRSPPVPATRRRGCGVAWRERERE